MRNVLTHKHIPQTALAGVETQVTERVHVGRKASVHVCGRTNEEMDDLECIRVASIFVFNYSRPVFLFPIRINVEVASMMLCTCTKVLKMCFCCFVWLSRISSDFHCIPSFFN